LNARKLGAAMGKNTKGEGDGKKQLGKEDAKAKEYSG